ncbi:hypothetical protein PAPYR_8478 [Paratrimastix pyriformis]|uniref:Guanylate cyclase domain-containing protein n=1 Tax=Paratrimastix pyriformis TaxID=342808 RepID=A0ABQ8UF41_9EUKA|nr:hypothetical protein PAPYR_8478 [Paratrimastix pyriformis]
MKIATFLNHTRNHFCLHFADSRLERDFSIFSHNLRLARYILFDLGTILLGGALLFLPTLISSSPFSLLDALFILTPFLVGLFFVGLLALFKKRALRKNREGLLVSNFLLSEGTWVAFFIIFHSIHIVLSYLYPEHVWDLLLFGHISPVWLRLIRWRLLPVLFLAAGCGYIAAALLVSPAQGVMKTLPLLFFWLSWQILAWRNDMVTRKMFIAMRQTAVMHRLRDLFRARAHPSETSRGLLVSCQQMGRATVVALHLHNYHMGDPKVRPCLPIHPSIPSLPPRGPLIVAWTMTAPWHAPWRVAQESVLAAERVFLAASAVASQLRLGHVRYQDDQLLAVSVESEVGPKHMARRLQALVGLLDQLAPLLPTATPSGGVVGPRMAVGLGVAVGPVTSSPGVVEVEWSGQAIEEAIQLSREAALGEVLLSGAAYLACQGVLEPVLPRLPHAGRSGCPIVYPVNKAALTAAPILLPLVGLNPDAAPRAPIRLRPDSAGLPPTDMGGFCQLLEETLARRCPLDLTGLGEPGGHTTPLPPSDLRPLLGLSSPVHAPRPLRIQSASEALAPLECAAPRAQPGLEALAGRSRTRSGILLVPTLLPTSPPPTGLLGETDAVASAHGAATPTTPSSRSACTSPSVGAGQSPRPVFSCGPGSSRGSSSHSAAALAALFAPIRPAPSPSTGSLPPLSTRPAAAEVRAIPEDQPGTGQGQPPTLGLPFALGEPQFPAARPRSASDGGPPMASQSADRDEPPPAPRGRQPWDFTPRPDDTTDSLGGPPSSSGGSRPPSRPLGLAAGALPSPLAISPKAGHYPHPHPQQHQSQLQQQEEPSPLTISPKAGHHPHPHPQQHQSPLQQQQEDESAAQQPPQQETKPRRQPLLARPPSLLDPLGAVPPLGISTPLGHPASPCSSLGAAEGIFGAGSDPEPDLVEPEQTPLSPRLPAAPPEAIGSRDLDPARFAAPAGTPTPVRPALGCVLHPSCTRLPPGAPVPSAPLDGLVWPDEEPPVGLFFHPGVAAAPLSPGEALLLQRYWLGVDYLGGDEDPLIRDRVAAMRSLDAEFLALAPQLAGPGLLPDPAGQFYGPRSRLHAAVFLGTLAYLAAVYCWLLASREEWWLVAVCMGCVLVFSLLLSLVQQMSRRLSPALYNGLLGTLALLVMVAMTAPLAVLTPVTTTPGLVNFFSALGIPAALPPAPDAAASTVPAASLSVGFELVGMAVNVLLVLFPFRTSALVVLCGMAVSVFVLGALVFMRDRLVPIAVLSLALAVLTLGATITSRRQRNLFVIGQCVCHARAACCAQSKDLISALARRSAFAQAADPSGVALYPGDGPVLVARVRRRLVEESAQGPTDQAALAQAELAIFREFDAPHIPALTPRLVESWTAGVRGPGQYIAGFDPFGPRATCPPPGPSASWAGRWSRSSHGGLPGGRGVAAHLADCLAAALLPTRGGATPVRLIAARTLSRHLVSEPAAPLAPSPVATLSPVPLVTRGTASDAWGGTTPHRTAGGSRYMVSVPQGRLPNMLEADTMHTEDLGLIDVPGVGLVELDEARGL